MTTTDQAPNSNAMVTRIKNILFTSDAEWTVIEAEPATIKGLYVGYACILAAIGPIARFIGSQIFGYNALFVHYRPPLLNALASAVVSYVLALVGVFVLALVIEALAPTFGGEKNRIQAFKVAIYSSTASWIAAIFALVPMVSALSIIGVFSLYLLYLGLPKLMKAPQDKALVYTLVTVVVAVVIFAVVAAVSGGMMAVSGDVAAASNGGSITVN